jgi:hypothetical protein
MAGHDGIGQLSVSAVSATALRILTWNIRAGGGTRLPRIGAALAVHNADVLVLTEYRSGEAGQRLRAVLRDLGLRPSLPHV